MGLPWVMHRPLTAGLLPGCPQSALTVQHFGETYLFHYRPIVYFCALAVSLSMLDICHPQPLASEAAMSLETVAELGCIDMLCPLFSHEHQAHQASW